MKKIIFYYGLETIFLNEEQKRELSKAYAFEFLTKEEFKKELLGMIISLNKEFLCNVSALSAIEQAQISELLNVYTFADACYKYMKEEQKIFKINEFTLADILCYLKFDYLEHEYEREED